MDRSPLLHSCCLIALSKIEVIMLLQLLVYVCTASRAVLAYYATLWADCQHFLGQNFARRRISLAQTTRQCAFLASQSHRNSQCARQRNVRVKRLMDGIYIQWGKR